MVQLTGVGSPVSEVLSRDEKSFLDGGNRATCLDARRAGRRGRGSLGVLRQLEMERGVPSLRH
jgi:hypothetical protein